MNLEEAIDHHFNLIKNQYANYPEIVDAVAKSIQETNFSFITGSNIFDRVYGRMLEIVVAVLYEDYLKPVNMKGADFLVLKSPLITIDKKNYIDVDLNDKNTYNIRALQVEKGELLEFKSAINGSLPIKFIIKDGVIKNYQYNNLLVALTKSNEDFYFPYLLYIKKEEIEKTLKENVNLNEKDKEKRNYEILENEPVEGEDKCIITLDLHIWWTSHIFVS